MRRCAAGGPAPQCHGHARVGGEAAHVGVGHFWSMPFTSAMISLRPAAATRSGWRSSKRQERSSQSGASPDRLWGSTTAADRAKRNLRLRRAMVVSASVGRNTVPAIARLVQGDEDAVRGVGCTSVSKKGLGSSHGKRGRRAGTRHGQLAVALTAALLTAQSHRTRRWPDNYPRSRTLQAVIWSFVFE